VHAAPLQLISIAQHAGRGTKKPPNQDIQIAHQTEAVDGGKLMLVTDERGGGLNAVGSDGVGPEGQVPACPGGGITFYNITDEKHPRRMQFADGSPAIFITKNFVQTAANCTVHYGTQFADEHLLVFAWYTQGTHVLRFTPDYPKNTIAIEEVATYIPTAASTWTSKVVMRNPAQPDELMIFTTDLARGFDVLAVNVPREQPAAPKKPPTVLHRRFSRLADTGGEDAATLPLIMLSVAAALSARRRARMR
jgi:hypothetical protein